MVQLFFNIYRYLFARTIFYRLNKFLLRCGLHGLGILNYENDFVSGEHAFLVRLLSNKDKPVIFDVGANEGRYSQNILGINRSAMIYAFEPHPITFKRLSQHLEYAKQNVQIVNAAVGAEDGMITLYDYDSAQGSSHASIYQDVIEDVHHATAREYQVKQLKLDSFVSAQQIRHIDLLKIDTEGNELNVLKGFLCHIELACIDVIHFEFNEMNVVSRVFFKDFWALLSGYDFYRLTPKGMLKIEEYNSLMCELFAYQNIVAIRKNIFH